jgi:hypothetical protein
MSKNQQDKGFFDWFVSLFKKEQPIPPPQPTQEEIEKEEKWKAIKAKYRLEYLETYKLYFVQYFYKEQWLYLRRWDNDYVLEPVRGNALRISDPQQLDSIIMFHQDWINEGHIFMSFN